MSPPAHLCSPEGAAAGAADTPPVISTFPILPSTGNHGTSFRGFLTPFPGAFQVPRFQALRKRKIAKQRQGLPLPHLQWWVSELLVRKKKGSHPGDSGTPEGKGRFFKTLLVQCRGEIRSILLQLWPSRWLHLAR